MEGPAVSRAAGQAPLARALRGAVPHRRAERQLLPAAGTGRVPPLARPDTRRLRVRRQGQPVSHPHPPSARPGRPGGTAAGSGRAAGIQAGSGAAAAAAHHGGRAGQAGCDAGLLPPARAGGRRVSPPLLVPRRDPLDPGRVWRRPVPERSPRPAATARTLAYGRLELSAAAPRHRIATACYGRTSIDSWARRMAERWRRGDVYVFFNNDPRGCGPRDAVRFAAAAGRRGLRPTRVPASAPDVGPART